MRVRAWRCNVLTQFTLQFAVSQSHLVSSVCSDLWPHLVNQKVRHLHSVSSSDAMSDERSLFSCIHCVGLSNVDIKQSDFLLLLQCMQCPYLCEPGSPEQPEVALNILHSRFAVSSPFSLGFPTKVLHFSVPCACYMSCPCGPFDLIITLLSTDYVWQLGHFSWRNLSISHDVTCPFLVT